MKYTQISIAAGLLAGLSAVILKVILINYNMLYILFFLLFSVISLILFQIALKQGKSGIVSSLFIGFSVLISVIGGTVLGESITLIQMLGVILVVFGSIVVVYGS